MEIEMTTKAVAYYRTSSATNVGGDSEARQRAAVESYAEAQGIEIVAEFTDDAVSGADPVHERPGFSRLLARVAGNGVRMVLVEDPTRFARDLMVQLAGHDRMRALGVELVPVNAPSHFLDDTPTARMVRQILGAVAEFEKAQLVAKLRAARERTGRKGGSKPVPVEVVAAARKLAHPRGRAGKRSLREIAAELAAMGMVAPSGKPYGAESVKRMLA
jgi:DNA invertase Pin-like site-specific DNA recombinase